MSIDTFTIGASLTLVALGAFTVAVLRGWVHIRPTRRQVTNAFFIMLFSLAGAVLIAPFEPPDRLFFFIFTLVIIISMLALEIAYGRDEE